MNPGIDFVHQADKPIEPMFHSHVFYEIYYFHGGICNYLIGDRIYSLASGDLILMNGMTLHCAKIDPTVPYIRSIIHFDPSAIQPYAELPGAIDILKPFKTLKNYRISFRGTSKEEVERILLLMDHHKQNGSDISKLRMELAFVDLLYLINDECVQPLNDMKEFVSEKEKLAQKIVTLLEGTLTEDLHMERLQEQLHVSRSYLAKIFKEVTGVTIFDYVYRKRINEARVIFRTDKEVSVTEVCYRLGFKHLAHFSRMFKQQTGMTPDSYKRKNPIA